MEMSKLVYEAIDNRFVRFTEPFWFESEIIKKLFPDIPNGRVEGPVGFVCDLESVPRIPVVYSLVANTSKKGGAGHDILCRSNSIPKVTKKIAADVYLEIMYARELLRRSQVKIDESSFKKRVKSRFWEKRAQFHAWWKRHAKYWVVRVAKGYFHRLPLEATFEEVKKVV